MPAQPTPDDVQPIQPWVFLMSCPMGHQLKASLAVVNHFGTGGTLICPKCERFSVEQGADIDDELRVLIAGQDVS